MSRLGSLAPEQMSSAQKDVYDSIVSGERGSFGGPFSALLYSSELTSKVEQLGVYIRYQCEIPSRQRELLICIVSAHWRADYEWYVHAPLAVKSGLSQGVLDEIADGKSPNLDNTADACVYEFGTELLNNRRVSDKTYAKAIELFGEKGTVEMTGLLGYYVLLAMTLNTFEVDVPDDAVIPWAASSRGDVS